VDLITFMTGVAVGMLFAILMLGLTVAVAFKATVTDISDTTRKAIDPTTRIELEKRLSDLLATSEPLISAAPGARKAASVLSNTPPLPTPQPDDPTQGARFWSLGGPSCGFCKGVRQFFQRNQRHGRNGDG